MAVERQIRWSLLGAGIAGRARSKAIERDERSRLVAVWRGRFADELDAPAVETLEEALRRCDAVAICSPDLAHPDQVEAALTAGRHVVVEYPLAQSADRARALLELARRHDRVLHVEHIELLDPVAQTLSAHLRPEWVRDLRCAFERGGEEGAGLERLARSNVARLHRITAVAGPIASVNTLEHVPGRLTLELGLASGATASCVFQQAPYYGRRTELVVESVDGDTWRQENGSLYRNRTPQTLLGMGSLFLRDHLAAMGRILDGDPAYVPEARVLHVLAVVDQLVEGRTGPVEA